MSQVQQVSFGGPRLSEVAIIAPWQERLRRYEADLLAELFRRNGRADVVEQATPPGYGYREVGGPTLSVEASGPIMQVAAHPGDGPDFFYATYLEMTTNPRYRNDYHEVLLTDGEGGVEGWSPEHTRRVRMAEAYAGARVVGGTLHFLGYPDGRLSFLGEQERSSLVRALAERIAAIEPVLLVVHPPKNDHPDHAYSFLLTLAALKRHAQAGGIRPTLLVHDVEFGLQQPDIWTPAERREPRLHAYPLHSPELLVDISVTHRTAQRALNQHQTQMRDPVSGLPKAYADLIDALAQLRGLQIAPEGTPRSVQAQGFSHIVIPGVTSEQNILPSLLPAGSLYQRERC